MYIKYWDYFLSIESDLENCSRYVDICENNFETYSIEFAKIIMIAASEIDSVCKEFCKLIDPTKKPDRIKKYADIILSKYPNIIEMEIVLPNYNISRRPFENWSNTSSPNWWKNNTDIKHNRTEYFYKANLVNSIDSVGGLLILLLYYYFHNNGCKKLDIDFGQIPKIINLGNSDSPIQMYPGRVVWNYNLRIS